VRDDVDRNRIADKVLRLRFNSYGDNAVSIALAWAWGNGFDAQQTTIQHDLMKSMAAIARYLRQPMSWVEQLSLDDLNRWSKVTSELLLAERGVKDSEGPPDPWGLMRTDD
jgi:hypothetical protein